MVFKKIIFQNRYVALETPLRTIPPFRANTILNFHFDYLITSLIQLFDGLSPFFAGHTHDDWLIIISLFSLQDTVIKVGWKLDACSVAAALRPAVEKPGPPHLTWKISQNIEPHTKHLTNIARDCFSSQAGDLVRDCKDCQVSVMSPLFMSWI